jgi:DNA-binding MarR family transcriptional regulator
MDQVLAGTGGTFHQWVALNFTAVNGNSIDRGELMARLADAQIDRAAAEAAITELAGEGLTETAAGSLVALTDAGRERYARLRAAIDHTTAPLFADLPADDVAATQRVLATISERAAAQLARA